MTTKLSPRAQAKSGPLIAAALLAAWSPMQAFGATNLLRNGDFAGGTVNWNFEQHAGAVATCTVAYDFIGNQPAARIEVVAPGTAAYHLQLNQSGLSLKSNQIYTVSFWGKANQATSLHASLQNTADYQERGYGQTVVLATDWQRYAATFFSSVSDAAIRLNFGDITNRPGVVLWLADVHVDEGSQIGPFDDLPIPGSVEAEHYSWFYDTTPANLGGVYRNDAVDAEFCQNDTGGCDVGWIMDGEWLAYDVNVLTQGVYTLTFRVAGLYNGLARIWLDEINLAPPSFGIPATGGWQTWQDVVIEGVALKAGRSRLMFQAVRGGFNLNYLQFDLASTELPLSVMTRALPEVVAGGSYSQRLFALGGRLPYSVDGRLEQPALRFKPGREREITGLALAVGTTAFRVQVLDATGLASVQDLSITVSAFSQPQGCCLGAFMPNGQARFEQLAGKSTALELVYFGWSATPDFPAAQCDAILAGGALPHLTWEPWNGQPTDLTYSLQSIIAGHHDSYIRRWAQQIRDWGKPLFLRWAHEMNGNWYPWAGVINGGANLTEFGYPAKADGPERYLAAYRHIHDLFAEAGASNVRWVWSPMAGNVPDETWNVFENYYPGDAYVDWLGVDECNWGTSQSWSTWKSLRELLESAYYTLRNLNPYKPIMVAEFASSEVGGDKAQWIGDSFAQLRDEYPQIKAVEWFDLNKETSWAIDSSFPAVRGFSNAVADAYFLSSAFAITNAPLPHARCGLAYAKALSTMGGSPPYAWSILSGELPPGLGLVSNVISGVAEQPLTNRFWIRVTDGRTNAAVREFVLVADLTPLATLRLLNVSNGKVSLRITGVPGDRWKTECSDDCARWRPAPAPDPIVLDNFGLASIKLPAEVGQAVFYRCMLSK